jgi:hypothetical protein
LIAQNKDQKGIFPNFADVMKQYEGRLVGILGTLIIHLIGGIVFMTIKLSSLYNENRSEFVIEFENDRDYIEEELIEVPLTLEKIFENDDRFLDIVRNIANDDVDDVDPMELQDRVKEEMIASGLLGEDNYIDDRRNTVDEMDEGDTAIDSEESKGDSTQIELSADEMASMYQGPTRIYYYLENRYKIEMPVPIYKCENSGKIVFNIVVNQRGRISDYSFDETASSRSDACLLEAAISSIKRTRFNPDSKSPKKQAGSITYEFMEQ